MLKIVTFIIFILQIIGLVSNLGLAVIGYEKNRKENFNKVLFLCNRRFANNNMVI